MDMTKIKDHKNDILFFSCGVAIFLIELTRNITAGNIWATTANCTGFVIFAILLTQIEIKKLFRLSTYIITGATCVAEVFLWIHWNEHIGEYWWGQWASAILNVWWILIVAVYCIRDMGIQWIKDRINTMDKPLVIMLTASTVLCAVSRSNLCWPIWFFFMFGLFYLFPFDKGTWELLVGRLFNGLYWAYIVIQTVTIPVRPFDTPRYSGFVVNSNSFADILAIAYIAGLFTIAFEFSKKRIWTLIFYTLVESSILAFSFMTGCRTVWAIEAFVTLAFSFLVIKRLWGFKLKTIVAMWMTYVVLFAIMVAGCFYFVRFATMLSPHTLCLLGEKYENKAHSWDPDDADLYTEFDEMLSSNLGRLGDTFGFISKKIGLVMTVRADESEVVVFEDRTVISGVPESINQRLILLIGYGKLLNLMGHRVNEQDIYLGWYHAQQTQNAWLHMAYYFGIPYGLLYLAMTILAFIRSVKICRKGNFLCTFPLLFAMCYYIFGMMEILTVLPGFAICVMFFILQHGAFEEFINESDHV